jgi:prepilin-type N-terminal cleavage/methylation domain-containing protein
MFEVRGKMPVVNVFHPEARMNHQPSTVNHQTSTRGFTIVECLIGLAIMAVLLTAVAVAFNGSVISYRENEDMFWTMNNARQALARMTSQLRVAGYGQPPSRLSVAHSSNPTTSCAFWTADGTNITYEFRNAENRLYLVKNATNESYVLCDHVTNAAFTTTSQDGVDATSVQISLTVQNGGSQRTLAAAAAIRGNL